MWFIQHNRFKWCLIRIIKFQNSNGAYLNTIHFLFNGKVANDEKSGRKIAECLLIFWPKVLFPPKVC